MLRLWINNKYPALLMLTLLGCGSALIYAVALAAYPLLRYAATPTQNLAMLVHSSSAARLAMAAGVLLLFAQFACGLRAVRAARHRPLTPKLIVGFALLFALLLLLVHPITSSDL